MIKTTYVEMDVVTAARLRIKNIFESANHVAFSMSGGKDSACVDDLLYKMCLSGEIDKNKLAIDFMDEEAIYPDVEQHMFRVREKWLLLGVQFNWYCIQMRHYSCFNKLKNEEMYICWDNDKKDVWVRPKPPFAIEHSKYLEERVDTFQSFLLKLESDSVLILGNRCNESYQRKSNFVHQKHDQTLFPIYDWTTTDVWKYIRENNVDFPEVYMYLYQCGMNKKNMRIAQFFSPDSMISMIHMCEYYPGLFEKICDREPNAYMAMLYYDTELFRRTSKKNFVDNKDYKKICIQTLTEDWRYKTKNEQDLQRQTKNFILQYGTIITENRFWMQLNQMLIAGDPKRRSYRGIAANILGKLAKEGEQNMKNEKAITHERRKERLTQTA